VEGIRNGDGRGASGTGEDRHFRQNGVNTRNGPPARHWDSR